VTVLDTARLRLRAYRDEDQADMVALAGNWQVARWLTNLPHPYTDADAAFWIDHVRQDHATGRARSFAIALRATDQLIGGCGLDGSFADGDDEPALGYWLGEPFWRQGYAREAVAAVIEYGFRVLGLSEIRALTDPANTASQRVLLACGLQPMGEIARTTPMRSGAMRSTWFCMARDETLPQSKLGASESPQRR
jgi:RimJ/RimL family protein N-acetyltransferase